MGSSFFHHLCASFSTSEFSHRSLVHPCRLSVNFLSFTTCQKGPSLSRVRWFTESQTAFLIHSALEEYLLWDSSKQMPEFHHLMFSTKKASPRLHITKKFCFDLYVVKKNISPYQFLDHLCCVIFSVLKKFPGSFVPCCVVPQADWHVVKDTCNDMSLRILVF